MSILYACVFYFCICSAQLSMFHMEKHSRNTLIIVIIISKDVRQIMTVTLYFSQPLPQPPSPHHPPLPQSLCIVHRPFTLPHPHPPPILSPFSLPNPSRPVMCEGCQKSHCQPVIRLALLTGSPRTTWSQRRGWSPWSCRIAGTAGRTWY